MSEFPEARCAKTKYEVDPGAVVVGQTGGIFPMPGAPIKKNHCSLPGPFHWPIALDL